MNIIIISILEPNAHQGWSGFHKIRNQIQIFLRLKNKFRIKYKSKT